VKTILRNIHNWAFRIWFHLRWEVLRRPPFFTKYYGYKLVYERGDGLISYVANGWGYEPRTIACALNGLPPAAVIVDIGSNIGLITLAIARRVPQARVHCFEPSPHPYKCLSQTISRNELDQRITLNNMALSIRKGTMDFFVHDPKLAAGDGLKDTGRAGAAQVIKVPVSTLDDYVKEKKIDRLDLIKIDTEGAELYVLQGGISTIKTLHPKIIFEASPLNVGTYNIKLTDVFTLITELDYKIKTVNGEKVDLPSDFVRAAEAGNDFAAYYTN
jgi:FkbM family methyltransferase